MPDCEITNVGKRHPLKGESVHKMLADYMEMQDQFIADYKDGTDGGFIRIQVTTTLTVAVPLISMKAFSLVGISVLRTLMIVNTPMMTSFMQL